MHLVVRRFSNDFWVIASLRLLDGRSYGTSAAVAVAVAEVVGVVMLYRRGSWLWLFVSFTYKWIRRWVTDICILKNQSIVL